jgi:hypothetical protein
MELPRLPAPLVMRQELLSRMLRDQPHIRVWEIVAPAGYGKTALLTQAARHEWRGARRLRWLTLGPAYDTPERLVEALGNVQGTDLFLDDVDSLRNPACWRVLANLVGSVSEDEAQIDAPPSTTGSDRIRAVRGPAPRPSGRYARRLWRPPRARRTRQS